MKNELYWSYNLPLQVSRNEDGSTSVLNYMPRKESLYGCELSDLIEDQTETEFFECAAVRLENLARLMRAYADGKTDLVCYPDEGLEQV